MRSSFDGRLYHATSRDKAEAFLRDGVPAHRSYWGVIEIADYYAETVADEGHDSVILSAPLTAFDHALLMEDTPGFEEPISTVIGSTERLIHEAWSGTDRSWRSSLDTIGSVAYEGVLPASELRQE